MFFGNNLEVTKSTVSKINVSEQQMKRLFLNIPIGWLSGEIWAPISIGCLFFVYFVCN